MKKRGIIISSVALLLVAGALSSISDSEEPQEKVVEESPEKAVDEKSSNKESHIYDSAEIYDIMNGSGTDVIGKYSLIETESDQCTNKNLTDWLVNYVGKNDFNYCIIKYTDKPDFGVMSIGDSMLVKNAEFEQNNNGAWMMSDESKASNYYLNDEGTGIEKYKEKKENGKKEKTAKAIQKALKTPTVGEQNALRSAESYLSFQSFSKKGLIEQLEFDQYTHKEAVYAAKNCGANWKEQAAKSAQSYLDFQGFSRDGLIEQLKFDGYTQAQAEYGVSQVGL